jgi:hypothetical protein
MQIKRPLTRASAEFRARLRALAGQHAGRLSKRSSRRIVRDITGNAWAESSIPEAFGPRPRCRREPL